HPKLGGYLQPDALDILAGGNVHPYAYASNNPVNVIDPTGLYDITPQEAIIELKKQRTAFFNGYVKASNTYSEQSKLLELEILWLTTATVLPEINRQIIHTKYHLLENELKHKSKKVEFVLQQWFETRHSKLNNHAIKNPNYEAFVAKVFSQIEKKGYVRNTYEDIYKVFKQLSQSEEFGLPGYFSPVMYPLTDVECKYIDCASICEKKYLSFSNDLSRNINFLQEYVRKNALLINNMQGLLRGYFDDYSAIADRFIKIDEERILDFNELDYLDYDDLLESLQLQTGLDLSGYVKRLATHFANGFMDDTTFGLTGFGYENGRTNAAAYYTGTAASLGLGLLYGGTYVKGGMLLAKAVAPKMIVENVKASVAAGKTTQASHKAGKTREFVTTVRNGGDELVDVFRAVKPDELADIRKTGALNNLPGLEGKYFTTSAESAASYAKQAVKAFGDPPYTIVKSQVPRSVLNQPGISATVDRGIPACVLPNKNLPGLVPQVLNYSPVP
ncbi:hypothetical protein, partial [Fastidiosibacter lacustris]|uniref:hypothetical protein n=1 Tax=Fastidiosibacter lacustris TaxID=2056695 RepID=UPI001300BC94